MCVPIAHDQNPSGLQQFFNYTLEFLSKLAGPSLNLKMTSSTIPADDK